MSGLRTKQLALRMKAAGAPDEAQLAAIREYTLADIPAEQLVVREFVLAHNAIDRDGEVFDEALLRDFAGTLVGKGVYVKHPNGWDGDSGPAEGRVFSASVESMPIEQARFLLKAPTLAWPPDRSEAVILRASAYFVRTADNAGLLLKLDAGIAGDVSIGFMASGREAIRDADGRELEARRLKAPGEALEMSLVWLGAQPGARAVKQAPRNEDEDMKIEEQLAAEQAEVKRLKPLAEVGEKATAKLDALKGALGDDAALADDAVGLAVLAKAGKAYRDSLVDGLVAADRAAGIVGDTAEAVSEATAAYASMPITALKNLSARLGIKDGGAGITPSEPNPSKPGGDGGEKAAKAPGHFDNVIA